MSNVVFTVGEPTYSWSPLYQAALQSGIFNITDNSPQTALILTTGTTQLVVQGIDLRADGSRHLTAGSITGFVVISGGQEVVRIDNFTTPRSIVDLQTMLTELQKPVPDFAAVNQASANLLLLEAFNVTGSSQREVFGTSLVGGDDVHLNGGNDAYFIGSPAAAVTVDGGSGRDFLQFEYTRTSGVNVDFGSGEVRDRSSNQLLANISSFEDMRGTQFDDRIRTSADANGSFFFEASLGNDQYEGPGNGYARLSYRFLLEQTGYSGGVNVNAATGTVTKPTGAGIDRFWGIDTIQGTNFADTFYGSVFDDEFEGMDGADSFNGSGGNDRVNYSAELGTRGVFVNLSDTSNTGIVSGGPTLTVAAHTAVDTYGKTDTLVSIERIIGTDLNDRMVGDSKGNDFIGRAGIDRLYGNGGNDYLDGGDGNDFLYGGDGADEIRGGTGNDTIFGDAGDDNINGGEGNDIIDAGSGNFDNISGSGGNDSVNGNTGFDMYAFDEFNRQEDANNDGNPAGQDEHAGDSIAVTLQNGIGAGSITGFFGINSTKPTPTKLALTQSFSNLERIRGTVGNDSFTVGSGFSNTEEASEGFGDPIRTGLGVFELVGGKGNDTFTDTAVTGLVMINYNEEKYTHEDFDDDNDYRWGDGGELGVVVNLSAASKTIADFGVVQAGKARDTWNNTDTINGAVVFEMTDAADYFFAGTAGVYVRGRDGDDNFTGGVGADYFLGGNDNDAASGGNGNDYLRGDDGNDTLSGGAGRDNISGGRGNDTLYGDAGNDGLNGDDGEDTIRGGAGTDSINGGGDNDLLFGEAGNDFVEGDDGDDEISGGDGDDELRGDSGNDRILGDAGDDRIQGGDDVDTLIGGLGDDRIDGDDGDDIIYGDDEASTNVAGGTDRINGGAGADTIYAGYGQDRIDGNDGNDTIYGGFGDDEIGGGQGNDTLHGEAGEDDIFGDAGDDTIYGGDDDDALNGADGKDTLYGGNGNDNLYGGDSNEDDILDGGSDNDALNGAGGNDTLLGGDGDDNLYGGDGNGDDILDGGAGSDILQGGDGNDTYVLGGEANGVDQIFDNSGVDTITSTINRSIIGWDFIENLTLLGTATDGQGNQFNNLLTGNANNNVLGGGDGNDTLFGNAGADTLLGEAGNDILVGGLGRDVMTGGTGNDLFDFNLITETAKTVAARDVIADFSQIAGNRDLIDLSDIDANTTLGSDQAFSLVAAKGGAFAGAGSLIWSQQNPTGTVNDKTIIMGDVNGDGVADFHIELTGLIDLTTADFIL